MAGLLPSGEADGLWRSLVSALRSGRRGPRFKSGQPDHEVPRPLDRLLVLPRCPSNSRRHALAVPKDRELRIRDKAVGAGRTCRSISKTLAYGFRSLEEFPDLWDAENPALQMIKVIPKVAGLGGSGH